MYSFVRNLKLKSFNDPVDLKDIIKPVYSVFQKYSLNLEMEYCLCCVDKKEVLDLCKKELKFINMEEIERFAFKALSTWGNLEDFKHFLPRMLEIEVYKEIGFHCLKSKLEYGTFDEWPMDEKNIIRDFFMQYLHFFIYKKDFDQAINLSSEFQKFIINSSLFKNSNLIFKSFFFYLLDNNHSHAYISSYLELLHNLYSTEYLEDQYINQWPENEQGAISFINFISNIYTYELFNKNTREKIYKMKGLLEEYWYKSLDLKDSSIKEIESTLGIIETIFSKDNDSVLTKQ